MAGTQTLAISAFHTLLKHLGTDGWCSFGVFGVVAISNWMLGLALSFTHILNFILCLFLNLVMFFIPPKFYKNTFKKRLHIHGSILELSDCSDSNIFFFLNF